MYETGLDSGSGMHPSRAVCRGTAAANSRCATWPSRFQDSGGGMARSRPLAPVSTTEL
jgi:hypothetical protein